jgi:transglycosylase-like protein with SLT domain
MGIWSFTLKSASEELSAIGGSLIAKRFIQSRVKILLTIIMANTVMSVPGIAKSTALSDQQLSLLVRQCARFSDPSVLQSVARIESHLNPLALLNDTKHISIAPSSIAAGVEQAKQWISQGYSVDIGLMQINSGNLSALGMTVEDALDPCRSLEAGASILSAAYARGASVADRQAALLIALSRYNTGHPLTGVVNGYANQVISAQSTALAGNWALQRAPNKLLQWDIWGTSGAELTSWVVMADGSSEIERAGAQTSDARDEGRAPASSSEKGEPYVLSAFQESEPSKP